MGYSRRIRLLLASRSVLAGLAAGMVCAGLLAGPKLTALVFSALVLPAPETYYVDSAGGKDANSGLSAGSAWRSISKVNEAQLNPGDQVLLRKNGVWTTTTLKIQASGTPESPIVIGSYASGLPPAIRGAGSACVELKGSHIRMKGVQARDCTWAGVLIRGNGNRLEGGIVAGNAAGIVIESGAQDNLVTANKVWDNNRMSVLTRSPGNDDSGAFGILIKGDGNEISENLISGSDAFSYDYGRDGAAIEIFGGSGNRIHHNTASANLAFAELGESGTENNSFSHNSVTSSLPDAVFLVTRGANDAFGPVRSTSIYHNSVMLDGPRSQGFVCDGGCTAGVLRLRNNIIQATWKSGYADGAVDENYNLFWGGIRQFTPGSDSLVADPLWVDPGAGDLRLRPGSPAAGKGVPIEDVAGTQSATDPRTSPPDLGAYRATD